MIEHKLLPLDSANLELMNGQGIKKLMSKKYAETWLKIKKIALTTQQLISYRLMVPFGTVTHSVVLGAILV